MSQTEKAALYNELKAAGVTLDRHYREYSTSELAAAVSKLRTEPGYVPPAPPTPPVPQFAATSQDTHAGQHAYQDSEEPLRVDEAGRIWYREEVRKPAYPKPRARRVLRYIDSGVSTKTVSNGRYLETFEEAGSEHREAEVRITVPSFQVGVYKDPSFPFRVHVYNDQRGFDLFDVQEFFGGADLVPAGILRVYISSDLCYDMRTTIRAIETAYRDLQLKGSL